jgi:hypothetical protein
MLSAEPTPVASTSSAALTGAWGSTGAGTTMHGSVTLGSTTLGSGRGKAKFKRSEVENRTDMIAVAAQSIMARQKQQDEDDCYGYFLAEKMKSVPKQNKTAAQIALLSRLDDFL